MSTSRHQIAAPMNFLSLAPVASASYSPPTTAKSATDESTAKIEELALQRANSTGSDTSDASTSTEDPKQLRFLKLGHSDGDWSEEVIES